MNTSIVMRYVAYGVLLGIYGLFAWVGKAPVDVFLTLLTGAITALGTVHVAGASRGDASDPKGDSTP